MSKDIAEITSIMASRRAADGPLISEMIEIGDRYNGRDTVVLPDVEGSDAMAPPVPRLIAQAIDGTAMRAASPKTTIVCPALDPSSSKSRDRAETRRKALYGRWFENDVAIKLYRSYRHLGGYGTCVWMVRPDDEVRAPHIEIRDPLTSYPELRTPDDIRPPRDVGFVFGRSIGWIMGHYPQTVSLFGTNPTLDAIYDLVEWIDEDDVVIGILGERMPSYASAQPTAYPGARTGPGGFELKRYPNKAGMVPVVAPRRLTLDLVQGQMTAMIGLVDLHERMSSLRLVANEKHVFPDMAMLSEPNTMADVVGGWHDGRSGVMNVVTGARGVQYLTTQVPPGIDQTIESMESAIRESGGASGMFGGENPQSLRTGRALAQMGSFSIDPRVEELQRIQERCLSRLNEAIVAVEKGYYGAKTYSLYTGLQGDDSVVTYTPDEDFDTGFNVVTYPIPGTDVSQVSVAVAQLVNSGLMSEHTGRVKHPMIDDPEEESRQIALEQMRRAVWTAAQQQASSGQLPMADVARILQLLAEGKSEVDAILTAHREAQERQATQAPAPGPGQIAPPESQPGIAQPGQGAEQPPPATGTPPVGLTNFRNLTSALNARPSAA